MCDYCDDSTMDMILDLVLAGLHLEAAIGLSRDAIVQAGLLRAEGSAADVLDSIRQLSETVEHQANKLRSMSNDDFRATVIARHIALNV